MITIEASEFPFVEELPKREKSRVMKLWDHFKEAKAIMAEKGMLVPVKLAGDIAGVSHQRILQLCQARTLERIELHGHPFITENSFVEWAKSERKAGRPFKPQSFGEQAKSAVAFGRVEAKRLVKRKRIL